MSQNLCPPWLHLEGPQFENHCVKDMTDYHKDACIKKKHIQFFSCFSFSQCHVCHHRSVLMWSVSVTQWGHHGVWQLELSLTPVFWAAQATTLRPAWPLTLSVPSVVWPVLIPTSWKSSRTTAIATAWPVLMSLLQQVGKCDRNMTILIRNIVLV